MPVMRHLPLAIAIAGAAATHRFSGKYQDELRRSLPRLSLTTVAVSNVTQVFTHDKDAGQGYAAGALLFIFAKFSFTNRAAAIHFRKFVF